MITSRAMARMMRFASVCITLSLITVASAAADLSAPGPYTVGWRQVTITRPNDSTFTALLFYPALQKGQDAPVDPADAPYPAISFGHGFLQSPNQYRSTLEHLASWGYVCIATESFQNLFPNHAAYAVDLILCLTWLEQRSAEEGAMLAGMIDAERFGLSGHSMGGGASLLAAAADARIKAVANLAAANTSPSAVDAAAKLTIPISLIAGSMDSITPVRAHGQLMYNAAPGPRQLPVIIGGFHCGFTDNTFPFCDSGGISREQQLAITRRLLTSFFNLHLKGDQSQWQRVWGPEALADPALQIISDPRIAIALEQDAVQGPAGGNATVAMTLTNSATTAIAYDLFAETAEGDLAVEPMLVDPIAPDESTVISVQVQVPAGDASVLLSARSQLDQATRGFAALTIEPHAAVPGDLNGDGVVNASDLLILLNAWGACPTGKPCPADLTGSGAVTVSDLLVLLSHWS